MLKVLKWTLYDICPENIGTLYYKMDFSEQILVGKKRKNMRNLEISILLFFCQENIFCRKNVIRMVMLCVWTNRNTEFYREYSCSVKYLTRRRYFGRMPTVRLSDSIGCMVNK